MTMQARDIALHSVRFNTHGTLASFRDIVVKRVSARFPLSGRTQMKSRPTILFAEDSESDMLLIQIGFERVGFRFHLHFVPDGLAAIEYLNGQGRYADRARFPIPCVLLTDLKMPKMNGFGLLAWVRSQIQWQTLPVIVVTGSDQAEDWQRAMDLGANSYVVKELLMRPPPALLEAILRCASPATNGTHKLARARTKRNLDD